MRWIVLSAFFFLTTAASPSAVWAQQAAMTEIAPTGRLRVGFQTGSPILAKRAPDGSVTGVVVDLGKFIAERLGVPYDAVVYPNQETYAQSLSKSEWDIVIGGSQSVG